MRRVLIVDDDEGIRQFVATALSEEGYEVAEAADGKEALARAEAVRPDLILLDLRMPVMDGWEFARAYRSRPGKGARLVIVTAGLDVAKDAREIGADGFLAKPFQLDDLLSAVDVHTQPVTH